MRRSTDHSSGGRVLGELECRNVTYSWTAKETEAPTLRSIDFKASDGEFVSVVGPSGSGKSTLLALLAGLVAPDEGQILLDGTPLEGPRREIGMVFQDYGLFPWLTAAQNVSFGPKMRGLKDRREHALALLERVGLAGVARKYPHQLSGGMRQRVAIARAIANDPECVLLDEPLGALDYQTRRSMQSFLEEVRAVFEKTMVLVTHDIEEAILLSDRIAVLTARPAQIAMWKHIDIPRPRQVDDAGVIAIRREIEELMLPEQTRDTTFE